MSLLESESQVCCRVVKASVPDGQGGQIVRYVNTRSFKAVLTPDTSASASKEIGGKQVSAKRYKVLYPADVELSLGDIIKTRENDKAYIITSDGNKPANASSIQYGFAYAEDWSVPDE